MSFLNAIRYAFSDISILISGGYVAPKGAEMKRLIKEVYDLSTPQLKQDRANLKIDRDIVSNDYKKAVEKAREIGVNSKQIEFHF